MTTDFWTVYCAECEMLIPFPSWDQREEWLREHRTTGHFKFFLSEERR